MGDPILDVTPATVGLSAATEAGISAAQGASASAGAAAMLGVLSMGGDPTSAAFAEALRMAGAAYLAGMAEHAVQRGLFAGGQGIAGVTFEVTEQTRALAASISAAL